MSHPLRMLVAGLLSAWNAHQARRKTMEEYKRKKSTDRWLEYGYNVVGPVERGVVRGIAGIGGGMGVIADGVASLAF